MLGSTYDQLIKSQLLYQLVTIEKKCPKWGGRRMF